MMNYDNCMYKLFILSIIFLITIILVSTLLYKIIPKKKILYMQQKILMVNNYDQIVPNLWLGNLKGASDVNFIKNKNIKAIVNCTIDYPFYFDWIQQYRVPVNDNRNPQNMGKMFQYLDETVESIHKHIRRNEPVFVHCYFGAQRSATVVVAYIMKKFNLSKNKAIEFVKQKRPIIFFNTPTFDVILDKYESLLKNN